MNLFELFNHEIPETPTAPRIISVEIKAELNRIIKSHGIDAPEALLDELQSIFSDPPPWKPWNQK